MELKILNKSMKNHGIQVENLETKEQKWFTCESQVNMNEVSKGTADIEIDEESGNIKKVKMIKIEPDTRYQSANKYQGQKYGYTPKRDNQESIVAQFCVREAIVCIKHKKIELDEANIHDVAQMIKRVVKKLE